MSQAKAAIIEIFAAGLVPSLTGSPGIGKSDLFRAIAEQFGLAVIDLRLSQCDPTDLNGFPYINHETGKASYMPMDTFPLETDPLPEGKKGWILFLDEITHASPAVQKASYKIILDRMVGQKKLHPKLHIACAGNLSTDNAMVEDMSTALQSRLIHLELKVDHEEWLQWAAANDIDHRITAYINFKPKQLHDFKPDHIDKTFACPRTWAFASDLLKNKTEVTPEFMPVLVGTLSEGVATEFKGFTKVYKNLITIQDISADPENIKMPTEASVLYALSGSIAHNATIDNIDVLMKFIKRLPYEFQVTTIREINVRTPELEDSPAMEAWIDESADKLFKNKVA